MTSMLKLLRNLLIVMCLAVLGQTSNVLYAQVELPQTFEIGPHGGLSYYIGDINPAKQFNQSKLQFGGVLRYNPNPRWTFRFDYTHATVAGSDTVVNWRPERGLSFRSEINDFSLIAEFNFFDYYTGNHLKSVSPYLFGGLSIFTFKTYANYAGVPSDISLRDLQTEGVNTYGTHMFNHDFPFGLSIPFGVGLKVSLSQHVGLTAEWRMQKTFTDYLDDVSTVYPATHATVTVDGKTYDFTDPTGNFHANQQRGDSASKDWFGIAGLSLTWRFNVPSRKTCNLSF